jgi:hypothetical protein
MSLTDGKMSCQELRGDVSDSPESSDSEEESQTSSHIQSKPKQVRKKFMGWKFQDTVLADILAGSFQERKQTLIDHFCTRTTPDRPLCVLLHVGMREGPATATRRGPGDHRLRRARRPLLDEGIA